MQSEENQEVKEQTPPVELDEMKYQRFVTELEDKQTTIKDPIAVRCEPRPLVSTWNIKFDANFILYQKEGMSGSICPVE